MKATDLMIGDWVSIKPLSAYIYTRRKIKIQDFANLHKMDFVPILLTPEILEKNGFKYNDLPYAQEWEQYGLSIYGENPKMINCGLNIAMNVTYVHQLQHALRLCGLDELADNFKI